MTVAGRRMPFEYVGGDAPSKQATNATTSTTGLIGIKRPAEMRECEGAPRAKRRFDRVAACLEKFTISDDTHNTQLPAANIGSASSSDDEEMCADDGEWQGEAETSQPLVEEPDDDEVVPKRIRLDSRLQEYLLRARESARQPLLEMWGSVRGNELTMYRPPESPLDRLDDPTMRGRIAEVDDEDVIVTAGAAALDSPSVSFPDEEEERNSSSLSPSVSPPHIVELPSSEDEEMMEI